MALPLYALTLFVSAFILFLVQPIVGKIILPKLGGTPQVWNTCMVFFQMMLLAGYAYTHNASTRLGLRQQLLAHLVLLCLPLIVLLPFPFALGGEFLNQDSGAITDASNTEPIVVTAANNTLTTGMRVRIDGVEGNLGANGRWTVTALETGKFILDGSRGTGAYKSGGQYVGGDPNPHSLWGFLPDLGSNPIPSTLLILFSYVALPFVVVATTAPLLQKWFVHTGHPAARDPYFLYGASNLGSMLSLILYPVLLEPYISLRGQGWTYAIGYFTLMAFVLACAAMVWRSKEVAHATAKPEPKPETAPSAAQASAPAEAQTGIAAGAPAAPTGVKAGQPHKHKGAGGGRAGIAVQTPGVHVASDDMSFGRRFRWVMLAAIPSSLMLGITTHITTDLSPMPLFWLVPLILYLLTFILVFARWPVIWPDQPHLYVLYAQPFCLAFMIMVDVWNLASQPAYIGVAIFAHVLGFFATTLMCHGELAKDRPGTRHLTEFYLWMSVGGMLGGVFNGLVAPVIFPKYWEFPLAMFAAALIRPRMFDTGLLDNFFASLFEGQAETAPAPKHGKGKHAHVPVSTGVVANESLVRNFDFVWPVAIVAVTVAFGLFLPGGMDSAKRNFFQYGIPLLFCCLCFARPLRFGLGVGAVLLLHAVFTAQMEGQSTKVSSRSYFGAISVKEFGQGNNQYRQLIHGHIDHGMNFVMPSNKDDRGNPEKDKSRLATTYYHREGPAGRVMEKFNWFPGKPNTYHADARLPASLVASVFADMGTVGLPVTPVVTSWSEPPFATVGLGTGTMASYGRVYQHVHFYEIDNQIQRLSLAAPTRDIKDWTQYEKEIKANSRRETWFNYLEQGIRRGSSVQVLMGDARLRMALPYANHYKDKTDHGGGPENFYHMMVVDAFSSDAIPAHLLTKEAFQVYFSKLTEDGILCVHTSNRFVELPLVVAAVSDSLDYKHLRGHDINDSRADGHYTSEWVMVARKQDYLKHLSGDTVFLGEYDKALAAKKRSDRYWDTVSVSSRYLWTDDYYNLLSVIRWR